MEHSISGSYDSKTNTLFDELHNEVGHVDERSATLVEDLHNLYKKLKRANKANYILKLKRAWGEDPRGSSIYCSNRKYNWPGILNRSLSTVDATQSGEKAEDVKGHKAETQVRKRKQMSDTTGDHSHHNEAYLDE